MLKASLEDDSFVCLEFPAALRIDKYTPEACSIIGNYYSLKGEHEKAVVYFQKLV